MSASAISRSLSNVKTELDFLRESKVISEDVFKQIMSQLPDSYNPNARSAAPPVPQSEFVEALYNFQAQQDGDLELHVGDKIEVLEKPSAEWFKGKCNGRVGMFPSNYVKPAFSGSSTDVARTTVPPPQYQSQQYLQPQQTNMSAQSGASQPPYPPPSVGYYQQPSPQQYQQYPQQQYYQQAPPAAQPEAQASSGHGGDSIKKFGSKLGNAAIFGAGATIGSDLINSIF